MDPVRFRVGDIAEAQMTVMVIPLKNERYKLKFHLQSLASIADGPYIVCDMIL